MMKKILGLSYREFDEKHQELINFFIELCLADRDFLKIWRFFGARLMFNNDLAGFINKQDITKTSKDLVGELVRKFESCIGAILSDKRILKPKGDIHGLSFRSTLIDLLNSYIDLIRSCDLPFNPEVKFIYAMGTSSFQEYKKYIFSKKQVFRVKIFLSNFKLKPPENFIRLTSELALEKIDMSYLPMNRDLISAFGVVCRAALVLELETERFGNLGDWEEGRGGAVINNFQYPKEKIGTAINKVLTALRLLKEGDVGVLSIKYKPPGPFSREINLPIPTDYQVITAGLQYKFSSSDLTKFEKIFRGLESLDKTQEAKICLSRFNKSYIRNDPADQIIDLVIAMEAITTSENNSLTYKVSTQIARLLINNEIIEERIEERKALQEEIKEIYDIRSKLVHCGKAKGDPKETVYRARQIVREISLTLIKLLPNNKYQDVFNKVIFS